MHLKNWNRNRDLSGIGIGIGIVRDFSDVASLLMLQGKKIIIKRRLGLRLSLLIESHFLWALLINNSHGWGRLDLKLHTMSKCSRLL